MLWLHLAYHDALLEKLEDGAEPLDDDSDLEYELEPLSCSVVASSTLHPGSVKSATHRVEHTASAASSSLKVSIHQCNAFPSSPPVEGPLKEELQAAVEVSDSVSDNLPKQQVQENGANEGVMEHKAAVSIPESESKNLEAVAKYCHGIFTILEILKQQNVLAAARDTPAPKYFGFSSLRTRMS